MPELHHNNPSICFVVNNLEFFVSHRLEIGKNLISRGWSTHIISPSDYNADLVAQGFILHKVQISRKTQNLFSEINSILQIYRTLKLINPTILHLITIKPYLYGGIAARFLKNIHVVSAIAGLGSIFSNKTDMKILRFFIKPLFKIAFGSSSQHTIFQNNYDLNAFLEWGILKNEQFTVIDGSGVDLDEFSHCPEPPGTPTVVMASRLLKDKGVREYIEAANMVHDGALSARFLLVGEPDQGNANSVTLNDIVNWDRKGIIEYMGYRNDISNIFKDSNIIVLPSYYREGLPKVLLEAAASGRAIVTTDHPGCNEAVLEGENGFLVPIKNSRVLAERISLLINNEELRKKMGLKSRLMAERRFSVDLVVDKHIRIYSDLLQSKIAKY